MKSLIGATVFISVIINSGSAAQRNNPVIPRAEFVNGEVLVRFKKHAKSDDIDKALKHVEGKIKKKSLITGIHLVSIAPHLPVYNAAEILKKNPQIEHAEPNYIVYSTGNEVKPLLFPDDPRYPDMYHLDNNGQTGGLVDADIDAPEAWDITTGRSSIVIAVIDTGLDYLHEDILGALFPGNLWINQDEIQGNGIDDDELVFNDDILGWDFVNNDNSPYDDNGHGTHVAGSIGAIGNNGTGISGVMWDVRIMPLKFLDSDGFGTIFDAMEAIVYAAQNGAHILNNSWGSEFPSFFLPFAIEVAEQAGTLFIAAAGNGGLDGIGDNNDLLPFYPASYDFDNIISVAATDHGDGRAVFSNFGATSVDLGAPGVEILSVLPNGMYGKYSGTSMATPQVSGVAGLIWSHYPALTNTEVRSLIRERIDLLPGLLVTTVSWGRLNAMKALSLPVVETTLSCEASIKPPDNLDFTLNVTNNSAAGQDFFILLYYILQDGTPIPYIMHEVINFSPGEVADVPLSIPLPEGLIPGKHSLKSLVLQEATDGLVVDSSICEVTVQ